MNQIEEFVRRINDDAYYKLISDSFTHLSRVVEIYDRLRKDIERFGVIYRIVVEEPETNLRASKEELFFDLIMLRQKELRGASNSLVITISCFPGSAVILVLLFFVKLSTSFVILYYLLLFIYIGLFLPKM